MASSAQSMISNHIGGLGHPTFYHGLASPNTVEQQDINEMFYDTPQGGWDTGAYMSPQIHDDSLISPFATAFDQATLMAQLYPHADGNIQDNTFQQPALTVPGGQDQVDQWNGHIPNRLPQQTFVPPSGMPRDMPSSPRQGVTAALSPASSSPVAYPAPAYAPRDLPEYAVANHVPTRSSTKLKGTKKRRKDEAAISASDRKNNKQPVEPEPKSRRLSVATSIAEKPIQSPTTPHTYNDTSPRPRLSRSISDKSQYSHMSQFSPRTSFSSSTHDRPSPDQDNDHPLEMRSQRERNRAAATKCRAKNKRAISELEESSKAVTEQREFLSAYAASLKNEVLALKNELLRHGDCDCVLIQTYLNSMARKVGEESWREANRV